MDARLLPGTDADRLTVFGIADGIGLGVLQGDEGEQEVTPGTCGKFLVLRDDILEAVLRDGDVVALLLEGHAEDGLRFLFSRAVSRIHLDDEIAALALRLEDFERRFGIGGRDDAVGDFALQEGGSLGVARVGEGDEIAVGRHAIGAARAYVGGRDGRELDAFDKVCLLQGVR